MTVKPDISCFIFLIAFDKLNFNDFFAKIINISVRYLHKNKLLRIAIFGIRYGNVFLTFVSLELI